MVMVYFGDALGAYGFGEGHPFGPDRIFAFWKETRRQGLDRRVRVHEPAGTDEQSLIAFHSPEYVAKVKALSKLGHGYLDYGDTPAFPGVFDAAATVVGSGLDGLHAVMSGDERRVFVPIAGLHHARRERAAGFCVFNDAGVMIELLRSRYGIKRVGYVDIDAHHGDGVFYSFESDPDVIIVDIHEDGRYLYPGTGFANETGKGEAVGTKLNLPMPPGAKDEDFERVWPKALEFLRAARPEILLLQAGADSIEGDPLTHMRFTPATHARVAADLCRLADDCCAGRLIVMGGGGYNRNNLALTWNSVLAAMVDQGQG